METNKGGSMRKLVLVVLVLLLFCSIASAAPVTIADPDGQSVAKVSNEALKTSTRSRGIVNGMGSKKTPIPAGASLQSFSIYAPSAGDNAAIFDTNSDVASFDNATPEFEIGIGMSTSPDSRTIDCGGAPVANGVYVYATDEDVQWSIVFDY